MLYELTTLSCPLLSLGEAGAFVELFAARAAAKAPVAMRGPVELLCHRLRATSDEVHSSLSVSQSKHFTRTDVECPDPWRER